MTLMKNLRTFSLLSMLLAFACLPNLARAQENSRRTYRFMIPDRYVGWVKIEFNIKAAPPLPFKDGYYVFEIPAAGRFQTSSDGEFGLADDEYYYVSGDSKRRLVSNLIVDGVTLAVNGYSGSITITNSNERPYKYIYFFIGSKADYEKFECKHARDCLDADEDGNPKVGNKKLND